MAISILNNIPSLVAQNQLSITGANLQKTLFQLSSGSRINSGADDAAGLAIADGLHANITALDQSAQNSNSGIGALQVADGSLAQITSLLNRSITLATESSNGTVSNTQRVALNTEFSAIQSEINRIAPRRRSTALRCSQHQRHRFSCRTRTPTAPLPSLLACCPLREPVDSA